jgi:hypothetical protein
MRVAPGAIVALGRRALAGQNRPFDIAAQIVNNSVVAFRNRLPDE